MAVYEQNALTQYKDKNGDMYIVYPITKRECIDGLNDVKTVTLPASGWSDTAPYTQLVAVEGITADDVPEVYLYYPDTINETNAEAYVEAYGYINKVDTQENAINVTAFYEKPAVDITIALKGV